MKLQWFALLSFLTGTCLLVFYNPLRQSQQINHAVVESLESRLSNDSSAVYDFIVNKEIDNRSKRFDNSPFYIEIYRGDSLVYWNDKTQAVEGKFTPEKLVQIDQDSLTGIIYLGPSEICIDSNFKVCVNPQRNANSKYPISFRNKTLDIEYSRSNWAGWIPGVAWMLFAITLFLVTIYQYKKLKFLIRNQRKTAVELTGLVFIQIIFVVLHFLPWFNKYFEEFGWFRPLNHSSAICPDIAHLVIIIWLYGVLVALIRLYLPVKKVFSDFGKSLVFCSGLYLSLLFGISLFLIEGFVQHPDVHLDMENLIAFNTTSFTLMVLFCVMMLLIFQSTLHFSEIAQKTTLKKGSRMLWQSLGWLCGIVLIFLLSPPDIPVWIFTVFIISYALVIDVYAEIKDRKITYLIWWMIMFSGLLAVSLFYFGLRKDITSRTTFAENFFKDKNDSIVQELRILRDSLIERNVFNTLAAVNASVSLDRDDVYEFIFKDSIDKINNTYEIELFDRKTGSTIFNNHFADFYKTLDLYESSAPAVGEILYNPLERLYITRFEIDRSVSDNSSWYLYIIRHTKDSRDYREIPHSYGYAIFKNGKLLKINDQGQTAPQQNLLLSVDKTLIRDGFSFVVSEPSGSFRMVTWKKVSGLIKPISLFSFIFTLCGCILLLLTILNTQFEFLPSNISVKFGRRSSLKTKIQLAIILLILFTFLIIGAITGFYFTNLIEVNQKEQKKEESAAVINNIRSGIQQIADNENALIFLKSKLRDLSEIHNKNLSLYDANGTLLGSTHNDGEYTRVPFALYSKRFNVYSPTVVGGPEQQTEYYPLMISSLKPFAFIGIQHTISSDSSGSILTFLSTILNAYIFLFLIAGAIAITIANSITQPLSILAEKLKKFKLGKTNEMLEWNSNDEIGTLIRDYNNLTRELERSAGLLAKTERDMAWREMAKQVAHEIKNPLTPMKLSIQYLEKASREYPEKAQDLIPRISSTLIEQIDNLSQIAGEFSNFASLPKASNEKVILNEIVAAVHDLFRKRDDMDINMVVPIDDLFVFADRNHLVRILNNLLKNAIQAIPETRRGKIEIELKRNGNDAIIRISDNGTGIPKKMRDKVFTPNFTTKSSGTGLGLAISANMIESCNGRIYFETEEDKGTDFFVVIPLMRLDDYLSEESGDHFVSLD